MLGSVGVTCVQSGKMAALCGPPHMAPKSVPFTLLVNIQHKSWSQTALVEKLGSVSLAVK